MFKIFYTSYFSNNFKLIIKGYIKIFPLYKIMQYNSLINKKIKKIKINVLLTFFNYFYLKIIIIYI